MKMKLLKLKIKKQQQKSLPLFYNYIIHNELIPNDPYHFTSYNQKLSGLINFTHPDKLISKIIDPTK